MMISCHKATELIERKQYSKLTLLNAIKLKIHLLMCKACALYEKHSELISEGLKKYFISNKVKNENVINPDLKKRIIEKLK